MMTTFKNQEQWAKAKRWSDCINVSLRIGSGEASSNHGYVYPDGAWIELLDSGEWHTIIANTEFSAFDLTRVELHLWMHHSCDNVEPDETPRVRMCRELKEYCIKHNLPAQSADELLAECQKIRNTFSDHTFWLASFVSNWNKLGRDE